MAKKKIVKKGGDTKKSKTPLKAESTVRKISAKDWHFLAILVLFAGFSLYAVGSFFNTTNDYLKNTYTSVVDSKEAEEESSEEGAEGGSIMNSGGLEEVEGSDAVKEVYEIFGDVKSDVAYAPALEALKDAGYVGGYADGTFRPDNQITRAEILTILSNTLDADLTDKVYANCFKDVADQWFAPFVCYAKDKNWLKGYADGTFRPEQVVTKAEALKIVLTVLGYQIPTVLEAQPFEDLPLDHWAAPYAFLAKQRRLINEAAMFFPDYLMTRADFAQMVYKTMQDRNLIE